MNKNVKKVFLGLSILGFLALASCNSNSKQAASDSSSKDQNPSSSESSGSNSDSSSIDDSIRVTGVYLNYDAMTLRLGKTKTLTATIAPENATNQNITWKSSNTDVVTVSNGVVTGVAVGKATVSVKTSDGDLTAECEVTVSDEADDDYVPDDQDAEIYMITNDTLDKGEYDEAKDEYTFAISSNYKQIYVNAPDKTIILELGGVTIQNTENSPIYVLDCDTIEISAKKKTTNNIIDSRPACSTEDSSQGKGAIYVANGDLKLKGTGTLNIAGGYYNGIHGKDDVKIQKQTLNVTAVNHGIKGNDSITITSGTINISCGGDGLHTENTDISSKGNQRGNVTINGGTIAIDSWCDAISASYNAVIEELDDVAISLTAKTNKYSSYDGEIVEPSTSSLYLKMNSSTYANGAYTYAAYINETWYPATYKGTQSSSQGGPGGGGPGGGGPGGGYSTSYIYEIERPTDAKSFTLYRFSGSNVTSYSTTEYNAKSDVTSFNSSYDTIQVSVKSGKLSFSGWSNYSTKGVSAKGIKAENEINIKSGTVNITAHDDGIHTNSDALFENDLTPVGDVNISGGNITVSSDDDGIHADCGLNISGGTINVEKSYEGLEGNVITVSGGEAYVYATDDGMNAATGKSSASITVTGGYLDIEVPTNGDTDGIDSNGTYTQSSGVVIVKGPGTAGTQSFGAAAVDADGAITINDGTIIVFGAFEKTPTSSLTKTYASTSTVAVGTHTISFTDATYTTTLRSASKGCVVYSSLGTATLD